MKKPVSATVETEREPSGSVSSGRPEEDAGREKEEGVSGVANESSARVSADLCGLRFTVIKASRADSNKTVISSGEREVRGDYLEIELEILNVGSDLAEISQFSFRLESHGITASDYYDYYGDNGTYGKYVSSHLVSASLLDYSTLNSVTGKLKVGETLSDVFLFFDLNPKNVGKNQNVTKDNAFLVIRKTGGSGYGSQVKLPLASYSI